MSWFLLAFRNYATFSGRSRRKEYWFYLLIYFLIFVALSFFDGAAGLFDFEAGIGLMSGIFSVAALLPSLAVTVRRLHDIDRSGWWILISLIPLLGVLVLMVMLVKDGVPGDNRFGPNPKGVASGVSLAKA